jgi:hypothetical protein
MITRDEWLVALGDAIRPHDQDSFTPQELRAKYGLSEKRMRHELRRLVETKKAILTWKRIGNRSVPSYKLV